MRPLLCALAGLALLRAAGAVAGEWDPGGPGRGRDARGEVGKSEGDGGGRDVETGPDGEREMEKERGR